MASMKSEESFTPSVTSSARLDDEWGAIDVTASASSKIVLSDFSKWTEEKTSCEQRSNVPRT
ncbi:MAG: hypothetical protein M3447_13050, partial [Acidobacteriota bacterium]|nr:hypothetical protein [Acidobacteriota bacterium]